MTLEKAAKLAANNLIGAFKALRLSAELVESGQYSHHAAPSGRSFCLDSECWNSIRKASGKLYGVIGSYPRENAITAIKKIVILVRDKETPIERAHQELSACVLDWLNWVQELGDWDVLHAVRGVEASKTAFTIGRCVFSCMSDETFSLWGKRFATGQFDPPKDASVDNSWYQHQRSLIGQMVALASVRACDADHAAAEGRRTINESLDLFRYGQITYGWPPEPVPEIGLAAISSHGHMRSQWVCFRRDKFAMSISNSFDAGAGALFDYCKVAPAWGEIEEILMMSAESRSEMQRRVVLALGWVGQAALASSLPIRIVAFATALETLLIENSESLGKKSKFSRRIAAFPKLPSAKSHVGKEDAEELYRTRSDCLHSGQTDVDTSDVDVAKLAVAQCLSGILDHEEHAKCRCISELLDQIDPSTDTAASP